MAENDEKKKGVKAIDKARKSTAIHQVDAVEDVKGVQKTEGVGKVQRSTTAGVGGEERALRYEDRERLLSLVDEEATKLLGKSSLPKKQKQIIQEAVRMAIDAALVQSEGDGQKEQSGESE
ncbi:MAG: hypothetical protein KDD60_12465 [Bdellovibrionales bacterium]|nr:hypothetical protein [Bdellovibrionales bacterium]